SLLCLLNPSMVTTSQPSASTANIEQALIGLPLTNRVQAPQTWTSQPSFAPVRPKCSRTRSNSVSRGSTSAVLSTPLTVREIVFFMRCSVQSKIQNLKIFSSSSRAHTLSRLPVLPKSRQLHVCSLRIHADRLWDHIPVTLPSPLQQPNPAITVSRLKSLPLS